MKGFLTRLLITALGLYAASALVPGVAITGWRALLVAALLLGLVNAIVRPILLFVTFPITILTLGLFILVVNGISIGLVAWLVPGFALSGLPAAILTSIVVGVTGWIGSAFVGGSGKIERFKGGRVETTGRRLDG
jgi:putative membrane protein